MRSLPNSHTYICLFVGIVSDLGLMSINLHRVENNNIWWTFPCLTFQFICRTWESLTFDMFSEDEEVSIRLWGCFTNRAVARYLVHIPIQISGDLNCLMSFSQRQAGDCFTSDECEQCMWHVTCDIITSWYVTVSHTDIGYMWDTLWC